MCQLPTFLLFPFSSALSKLELKKKNSSLCFPKLKKLKLFQSQNANVHETKSLRLLKSISQQLWHVRLLHVSFWSENAF